MTIDNNTNDCSRRVKLEVCCGDIDSVIAANRGGASRIELCSALADGGVTPSLGFMTQACRISEIPVNVLIRPRGGDFVYTSDEVEVMACDIKAAKQSGCNAVVIGALTPEGDIDMDACRVLVEAADGVEITFHRAFDLCRDPFKALEQVIELGCNRLLTSGLAASAEEGADMLRRLNEKAAGRLTILAGAGVSPANAAAIVTAAGVSEIHASARSSFPSPMLYRREGVPMGAPGTDEYSRKITDEKVVKSIVESLDAIR